jgi:hypothetical protein
VGIQQKSHLELNFALSWASDARVNPVLHGRVAIGRERVTPYSLLHCQAVVRCRLRLGSFSASWT